LRSSIDVLLGLVTSGGTCFGLRVRRPRTVDADRNLDVVLDRLEKGGEPLDRSERPSEPATSVNGLQLEREWWLWSTDKLYSGVTGGNAIWLRVIAFVPKHE
jgi:hypothetical protein